MYSLQKEKKLNIGALDFDISTTGLSLKDASRRGLNLFPPPPSPDKLGCISFIKSGGFIRNVGFWMHVVFLLILV